MQDQLAKALAKFAKEQQSAENERDVTGNNLSNPNKALESLARHRGSTANSTGYTCFTAPGHLKRRSAAGSTVSSQLQSRRPPQ